MPESLKSTSPCPSPWPVLHLCAFVMVLCWNFIGTPFPYSPYLASLPWPSILNSDVCSDSLPYISRVGYKQGCALCPPETLCMPLWWWYIKVICLCAVSPLEYGFLTTRTVFCLSLSHKHLARNLEAYTASVSNWTISVSLEQSYNVLHLLAHEWKSTLIPRQKGLKCLPSRYGEAGYCLHFILNKCPYVSKVTLRSLVLAL